MTDSHSVSHDGAPARGARETLLDALPLKQHRYTLAGISTAVLEGGDGPPLILLHGPGAYAAHWLRVIPELSTSHRVIAPDLPGHGASDGGALDAERVLAWLGELIDQTSRVAPSLVGQLLSGAIAARFAIAHGDRVARLVLSDTFGLQAFAPAPEFGRALHEFMAEPTENSHDALWRHCAYDLERLRDCMGKLWRPFAAYNMARARSATQKAALEQLMALFAFPVIAERELAGIAAPTTLIWGRHDRATPLATAQAASARLGWPLHVIEEANDDPVVEQPDAFVRALRSALE